MELKTILAKVEEHFVRGLPFVLYSLPESDAITVLLQKDNKIHTCDDYSEDGFVMVPFSTGTRLMMPEKHCEKAVVSYPEKIAAQPFISVSEDNQEETDYLALVSKARKNILDGKYYKIVTSRQKKVQLSNFDLSELIPRLFGLYPQAFGYVWYHPHSGLWCGATPEVLVKTNGKEFNTMALAGTNIFQEDQEPNWTQKEISEQKWVVEAIADKLQHTASVVRVSKIKNHRAGSLVHLRTDFNGVVKKGCNTLATLVASLHPTPAVCGTPEKQAKQFIIQNENYDRAYYTGFLGPNNTETKEAQLFVNLRCMQILDEEVNLFVGGGITLDSVPKAEWEETKNKLQTMLQVIAPMLSIND